MHMWLDDNDTIQFFTDFLPSWSVFKTFLKKLIQQNKSNM